MFRIVIEGKTEEQLLHNLKFITNRFVNSETVVDLPKEVSVEETIQQAVETPAVNEAPVATQTNHEVDSEGCPWDKRIHAGTKTQTKDGKWKKKKGLDDATWNAVRAEIMGTPAVTQATPVVTTPEVVQTPVVETPAATLPPMTPPTMNGHTVESFTQNFPMVISGLISEGKINQDYVNQLAAYFKVTEIWNITDAQKAEMFQSFVAAGLVTQVA